MKVSLEVWEVGKLKPYARNSKIHADDDVGMIRASIERFGFNDPIGVLSDGEIVEGHGRLEAAKLLGMDRVPVIVLRGMGKREADLYRIAHNKISQNTTFDFRALVGQLRMLSNEDIEIGQMGFTETSIRGLFRTFPELSTHEERTAATRGMNLSYDIIWDDENQKKKWTAFLKKCQKQHPELSPAEAFATVVRDSATMRATRVS